ncbi:hypothetical protein KJA13_02300 [Patescibacteria group bacterium]|nr:hypothetical protein [Patescibacteria group bacterium]
MEKRLLLLVVVLVVVGLGSSPAFALDPMGPPTGNLRQGQSQAGIDYSYSTMDLKLTNGKWTEYKNGRFYDSGEAFSLTLKNFKMNKVYANFGYGIFDNWDLFLRLGGADAKFGDSIWEEGEKFDGPASFTIGFGTKATFYQEGPLKLGGLFQASWADLDGHLKAKDWADSVDIELTEMQIAIGPSYELADGVSIYGGPFFHFVNGDLDDNFSETWNGDVLSSKYSWDIGEASTFGYYIGFQGVNLTENIFLNIEYQRTASADALGLKLIWRF